MHVFEMFGSRPFTTQWGQALAHKAFLSATLSAGLCFRQPPIQNSTLAGIAGGVYQKTELKFHSQITSHKTATRAGAAKNWMRVQD